MNYNRTDLTYSAAAPMDEWIKLCMCKMAWFILVNKIQSIYFSFINNLAHKFVVQAIRCPEKSIFGGTIRLSWCENPTTGPLNQEMCAVSRASGNIRNAGGDRWKALYHRRLSSLQLSILLLSNVLGWYINPKYKTNGIRIRLLWTGSRHNKRAINDIIETGVWYM